MKAKYNAAGNYLEELPGMQKSSVENILGGAPTGVDYEIMDELMDKYLAHKNSLRRIPCHPSCVGKWSDGQILTEDVDYVVGDYPVKAMMSNDPKHLAFPLPVKSEASELERMGLLLMQKDAVIEARDARIAELEGEVNDMKDEISSKDSIVEGLEQQVATWSKQDCVNVSRIKDIEAENLQMRDGLYCIIGRIEGVEWEGLEMIQAIQKIKEYATEALKTT